MGSINCRVYETNIRTLALYKSYEGVLCQTQHSKMQRTADARGISWRTDNRLSTRPSNEKIIQHRAAESQSDPSIGDGRDNFPDKFRRGRTSQRKKHSAVRDSMDWLGDTLEDNTVG